MSSHIYDHHPHFEIFAFKNKEIDALYLTLAFVYFAAGLVGVFVPIYFWELGFSISSILFFYLLQSAYFILAAVVLIPVLSRISDKAMIIINIPFLILYFLGLNYISDPGPLFYLLPLLSSISALFLWVGYHTNFSFSTDGQHLGEEMGGLAMVSSVVKILAPLIGGFLIGGFGFHYAFIVASILLAMSIIPLFWFPRKDFIKNLNLRSISNIFNSQELSSFNKSSAGYALEHIVGVVVWPLFLFLLVGGTEKLGGIVAIGFLMGGLITYVLGRLSDRGGRKKIIKFSSLGLFIVWVFRTLFQEVSHLIGSHFAGDLIKNAVQIGWKSQFYKIARKGVSPGVFVLAQEIIYRFARVLGISALIVLSFWVSVNTLFVVAFAIAAISSLAYLYANKQAINT